MKFAQGLGVIVLLVSGAGSGAESEPDALATSLQRYIKTLSRPIRTYHYFLRTRIHLPAGPVPGLPQALLDYLHAKTLRYWDLTIPTNEYATASGLYVGTDPVMCRTFGGVGDVWAMARIVLPAGFRFVDVRRGNGDLDAKLRFQAAARQQLSALGCAAEFPELLLTGLESQSCRKAAVAVLKTLDVDGILYDFPAYRFPACAQRPQGGIIILHPNTLEPGRIRLFTSDYSANDGSAAERAILQELFKLARVNGSRRPLLWSNLTDFDTPRDVEEWMRSNLFGCGAHPEDALSPN
jgi:hypothetical protein